MVEPIRIIIIIIDTGIRTTTGPQMTGVWRSLVKNNTEGEVSPIQISEDIIVTLIETTMVDTIDEKVNPEDIETKGTLGPETLMTEMIILTIGTMTGTIAIMSKNGLETMTPTEVTETRGTTGQTTKGVDEEATSMTPFVKFYVMCGQ